MDERIYTAQSLLKQKKCDMLALSDKDTTHRWLIGSVVEHSLIFVPARGKPTIVMSPLEQVSAEMRRNWNAVAPKNRDEQKQMIERLIKKVRRFAVSGSTCSLRLQQILDAKNKKKFVDIEKELLELRETKTANEIVLLQKANELTARCFNEVMNEWRNDAFRHELDVVRFIKQFALAHDAGLSFEPIVASGKNAAVPHHSKSTVLNKGFCVIDFGFIIGGYHADMTRTVYLGKPSVNELLRYNKLLEIQEAAIALVKPGVKCADLHQFVVKMLGTHDAELFIHSLGHGVGLDIHELPNVSANSDAVLVDGMCITIEPGMYDSKSRNAFGMRIEDSLVVVKNGHINLTHNATKSLIILDRK